MNQPSFPMQVSVAQAQAALAVLLPVPEAEEVLLAQALGRTLAADLQAKVSHPSTTESALDGIACREADTLATPVVLRVVGESRAGAAFAGQVGPGECIRIYTGATLPAGADAICPVEQLEFLAGSAQVRLLRPARPQDVRPEGSDFRVGETVMPAGLRLTPARLALAAALGHDRVLVKRKWRVALLSTGDEVVTPGQPLLPGQVYDSNSVGLQALLREAGCQVVPLGTTPDSLAALQARLQQIGDIDLLLTSGGVSMGRYDFMRDLLIEKGEVKFWKIGMRPGGPAILGVWNGLPVFGLPGNPVSSLVVFQVVVRPVLTGETLPMLRLRAATSFRTLPDKVAYWRACLVSGAVQEYHQQGSGILRSLSEAQALVVVEPGQIVHAGDEVDVILL